MWCCLYQVVSSICCFATPSIIPFSSWQHSSQWSQHLLLHTPTNGFRRCATVSTCLHLHQSFSWSLSITHVPTHTHTHVQQSVWLVILWWIAGWWISLFFPSSNTSVSVCSVTQPANIFVIQLRAHLFFGSNPSQDQDPVFLFVLFLHTINRDQSAFFKNVLLLSFKPE